MVVKAVSEQGVRLNIRKATLREWRREFARHLREQCVPANATERVVRGETRTLKKDGIYRATRRGDSSHMRERVRAAAVEAGTGRGHEEPAKSRLIGTRLNVVKGWRAVEGLLVQEGYIELARSVSYLVSQMPPPLTEKEQLAQRVWGHSHRQRADEHLTTR
jgi:hypothetical protein